jgi:transposase
MDWTMHEGYGIPIGSAAAHGSPQEVSPVSFTLHLSSFTRKQRYRRLQHAYGRGALRVVRRLQALLALAANQSVQEVAEMLNRGQQTIRDYRNAFLLKGVSSLGYTRPSGRPSTLPPSQRRELAALIKAGPQAAGYPLGCWNTPRIQDLIQTRFGVAYHPHDLATVLHHLGFSYQKARFVSDHLNEAKRLAWRQTQWPRILRQAQQRKALLRFGDEASFAQWGSLSSTWAPTGEQPAVRTSGKRKGYKVCGLIDSFSGRLISKGHEGRLNSESSAAFLRDVWSQTRRHVVVIQDGARSHTSQAMQDFFKAHAARLTIEPLPSYSPDFNPIEHLWKKVKKSVSCSVSSPRLWCLRIGPGATGGIIVPQTMERIRVAIWDIVLAAQTTNTVQMGPPGIRHGLHLHRALLNSLSPQGQARSLRCPHLRQLQGERP